MELAFVLMMGAAGCFCISAFFAIACAYKAGRLEMWECLRKHRTTLEDKGEL